MLSKISIELSEKEKQILNQLFENIDNNKSTVMNSGAGSGKTYALVECLKYVLKEQGKSLSQNNQHVICITYTNVAANEISERIGNSDIIYISTIHKRLWDLIKPYQNELVELHSEKLEHEINNLQNSLISDDKYKVFHTLSDDELNNFIEIMTEKKDNYYDSYNLGAADFRKSISPYIEDYKSLIKNVGNFKSYVNNVFRIENYKNCLENIKNNVEGFKTVEYNTIYNTDRLHKMIISHDTVLEYGLKLIRLYDKLKEIIIDSYPYFFVDEYQDTSENVVRILSILHKHSRRIKHPFFVGYFGDNVQSIYEDGIGNDLHSIHEGLYSVDKNINRRSCTEVIDVANRIRNDRINQESIYEDSTGGTVKFYNGRKEDINSFILNSKKEMINSSDEKLHCFLLTNESVAVFSGFENFFSFFKSSPRYKRYFDQLSTETLSNDLDKLGDIQLILYNTLDLYNKLFNEETSVTSIIDTKEIAELNIEKLRKIVNCLKGIKGQCLLDLFQSIESLCQNGNDIYKRVLQKNIGAEVCSLNSLKSYIKQTLFSEIKNDEEDSNANDCIEEMLKIDLNECIYWYNYINRQYSGSIVYHTFHGTKGLEFDNVIIIMGNSFGRQKKFFDIYFANCNNEKNISPEIKKIYYESKNLLYVSVTRAKKKLRILYTDDINDFKEQIKEIFKEINQYPC